MQISAWLPESPTRPGSGLSVSLALACCACLARPSFLAPPGSRAPRAPPALQGQSDEAHLRKADTIARALVVRQGMISSGNKVAAGRRDLDHWQRRGDVNPAPVGALLQGSVLYLACFGLLRPPRSELGRRFQSRDSVRSDTSRLSTVDDGHYDRDLASCCCGNGVRVTTHRESPRRSRRLAAGSCPHHP